MELVAAAVAAVVVVFLVVALESVVKVVAVASFAEKAAAEAVVEIAVDAFGASHLHHEVLQYAFDVETAAVGSDVAVSVVLGAAYALEV